MAFKQLPKTTAGPPLKDMPQARGKANINPVVSLDKRMPVSAKVPSEVSLPSMAGKPTTAGKPESPGKSAEAPGQRKKLLGLQSAKTLTKGFANRENKEDNEGESRITAIKAAVDNISKMPQPALRYRKRGLAGKKAKKKPYDLED